MTLDFFASTVHCSALTLRRCAMARLVLTAGLLVTGSTAFAQADWKTLTEKVRGQKLVMVNQGNKAFDTMIDVFSKKYGVKVLPSLKRLSEFSSALTKNIRGNSCACVLNACSVAGNKMPNRP